MALEWKYSICPENGDEWKTKKWTILVNPGTRRFFVQEQAGADEWDTFIEASAWCEEQERAAEPPLPLPAVGSVWGHPDKPETRRFVRRVEAGEVWYSCLDYPNQRSSAWHSWVRETGAVDLLADRAELVRRAETAEHQRNLWEADSRSKANEADEWKRRAEAAEKDRDRLRNELTNLEYHNSNQRKAALDAGWQPSEFNLDAYIRRMAKERNELRAAKERLLSVLRRIYEYREMLDSASRDAFGQIGDIESMAREAIAKEGGGNG